MTDIPPGVLNVITSSDIAGIGEQLVRDPRVDMISFTGSTQTGRRIMAAASDTVKKLFLELCGKSAAIILDYADFNIALLIGGVSFEDQDRKLERGADVLIATPGRLLDHFERGKLLLTGVEILVIDEADRMLDMGFIPDIERICKLIPFTRQTLFFSATMPPEITKLTEQFLHAPVRIEVARAATTASTVTWSSFFHSTNLNGPVPTGLSFTLAPIFLSASIEMT